MKNMAFRSFSVLTAIAITVVSSLTAFAADTKNPSDVTNIKGSAMNESVKLSWAAATDDTAVTGYVVYYGLNTVGETGKSYDKNKDVGDVLEATIDGLKNDTKYYFSVIAYDAAKNESLRWGKEIQVTPSASAKASTDGDADDAEAPKVSKVEALNGEQVSVVFSEEVVLPTENAKDAFTIEDDEKFTQLEVLKAELDEDDDTNKTVILTTAVQTKDASYKLTVSVNIKDKSGNPIISGTSDTGLFTGSDKAKPADDDASPKIVTINAVDSEHIVVNFNEVIVLGIDPSKNFDIYDSTDNTKKLDILEVKRETNSEGVANAAAFIKTSPQESKTYSVTVIDVKDEAGNVVGAKDGSGTFKGVLPSGGGEEEVKGDEKDTTAPKDVAKLLAKGVLNAAKYDVELSWVIPKENIGDVIEQIVYMSINKGEKYDKESTLGADATTHTVDDLEAGEYWFKITQKDAAGNESEGTVSKIILADTGPGIVGLAIVSLGLGRLSRRKKF